MEDMLTYNQRNLIHSHWTTKVLPNLQNSFSVPSFEDYLRRLAGVPSFHWIRDMENMNIIRSHILCDAEKFSERYTKHCVTYGSPANPDHGFCRAIYQINPRLHLEALYDAYFPNSTDELHFCAQFLLCYENFKDLKKFFADIDDIKLEGEPQKTIGHGGFGMRL